MDTKPLEIEAESYIRHNLLKYDFKVIKPDFDTEGADLLIVDNITNKFTHFLKIQCKGRTLKNSNHIEIPRDYVVKNFIVFLYVKTESYETLLFIFFYEDIIKWRVRNNNYIFNFSNKKLSSPGILENRFTNEAIHKINAKLKQSKIKKYTTLIIDGIFLDHAIMDTIKRYKEIYPNKQFKYPSLNNITLNILSMYDNFKSESKSISCFVYYSKELNLPDFKKINNKFSTDNGLIGDLYTHITEEFVSFEILEKLERTINTENIILVADDPTYESSLNKLKEKDIDITLVMFASHAGRTMFTKHMWGDIAYPIARSLGLENHEW